MMKIQASVRQLGDARLMVAIAGAHAAADAASRIAAEAMGWASRTGAGATDAHEAWRCAARARKAAEDA